MADNIAKAGKIRTIFHAVAGQWPIFLIMLPSKPGNSIAVNEILTNYYNSPFVLHHQYNQPKIMQYPRRTPANTGKQSYLKAALLILSAAVCISSYAFTKFKPDTDNGRVYKFTIAKKGKMIADATCYAWIPQNVGTIRCVIVHLHGCTREGDAPQMMYDIQWKELAKKWHAVLLAPSFISGGNARACVNWYNPANGSDPVFLEMLDTLAKKAGHPEIGTVPWALWGHSGGSLWVTAMTGKYPQRVAVAVDEACGYDISDSAAALKVPMLHHNGIQDLCYNNAQIVANGRKKGALWAHATNPFVASPMDGHQVHDLRFLAIPWIDACLGLRLPEQPGSAALRSIDTTRSWYADTATRTIASSKKFKGNRTAAFWFPNEALAQKWVEYMSTGTVTDHTPPPAPYNLMAVAGNKEVTLYWDAAPDLESGIKTFIIYRNGRKLTTLHYNNHSKYSKLTGYQRWNDGDQPTPIPAPEMVFTDTTAGNNGNYTYQVSTVNWSGVAGSKSGKLKLRRGKTKD